MNENNNSTKSAFSSTVKDSASNGDRHLHGHIRQALPERVAVNGHQTAVQDIRHPTLSWDSA